jgi:perosamine synthetase
MSTAPMPRFRIYTRASDYLAFFRDMLTGRATTGDDTARLERAICEQFGVPHAFCIPQGRVGIYLAIRALVKPGQKVVLSPYTIADVINMVICAGGVPVFADIDRPTTNVRTDTIEALIDGDTAAVMVTHLHGLACDIEAIAALCKVRGLALIEDAAQACGARVNGRAVGTFGDVGVFSFGMYKNVTAVYGGAVVSHDKRLHDAMWAELANTPFMPITQLGTKFVKALVTDICTSPWLFKALVYWIFRFGYLHDIRAINKFVMVELDTSRKTALPSTYLRRFLPVQARMVLRQLDHVDANAAVRLRYSRIYSNGLGGIVGLITPPFRDDGSFVYNYFPIQYRDRDALVRWVMEHRRDMAVQHLKNCASLAGFAPEFRDCPNAELTANQVILLPNYPAYGEDEVRKNVAVIRRFFDEGPGRHDRA